VGPGGRAAQDVPHRRPHSRLFGYAGPSTAKATEAFTKYIITDTYAKAAQGMKAEDAVHWAELELKKIYEA
jgi:multiple sugar transport system substrate-binding protein